MPIINYKTSNTAKTFMNPNNIPLEFQKPVLSLDAFNNVYTGKNKVQPNYTLNKGGYVKKYNPGGEITPIAMSNNFGSKYGQSFNFSEIMGNNPTGSYSDTAGNTFDMGDMGGDGPNMSNVSAGLGAVSSIATALDNDPNSFGAADTIGTVAQFASMGAAAGPIGAGVGALVGGVVSIFKKRQEDKAKAKAKREEEKRKRVAGKKEHLSSIQNDRMAEAESSAKAQSELLATAKSLSSTSAGKYFYNKGGMTQGAYNHSTNPLTVVDKYGNNTGMELTGGEGVFDKPAMNRIKAFAKGGNFQQLGQFVSNEMQTWKHK